ncbi:MAG: D-hexose-6-phosphate mutarotase [Verrucomicrobiota bacterium]
MNAQHFIENISIPERLRKHQIPGRVTITKGGGDLPKINVRTGRSTAEIYLHGAHVTAFQKNGEPPLLFLSRLSQFAADKPIRGGVPICFPWFGPREGAALHGFARLTEWELVETAAAPNGDVTLCFHLPESAAAKAGWPAANVSFIVTVGDKLTMELAVTNSANENFSFESCLHTYFAVGDIAQVSIAGLKDAPFDDFAAGAGGTRKAENSSMLRITKETNRIYHDTTGPVEIHDKKFQRTIRVEKFNSHSTVVWNPWTTQKMPDDFDPAEHKHMICVESGNLKQNKISLPPGKSSTMKVTLGSRPV